MGVASRPFDHGEVDAQSGGERDAAEHWSTARRHPVFEPAFGSAYELMIELDDGALIANCAAKALA